VRTLLSLLVLSIVGYGGASWYLWAKLIFVPSREVKANAARPSLEV